MINDSNCQRTDLPSLRSLLNSSSSSSSPSGEFRGASPVLALSRLCYVFWWGNESNRIESRR